MRILTRRLLSGLAATAAAAALVITTGVTPAHAGRSGIAHTRAGNGFTGAAGMAQFYDLGEKFTLFDWEPDGAGVYVYWMIDGVNQPGIYFGGGSGQSQEFNKSIPEGRVVNFRVCLRDGGVIQADTCSVWANAVA
ncbi:hypothetical protein [Actinoplanes sp. DH11]|uniref:hypothetical protein n=1 Tax=Actinoplanes sp. DH11 TaxID=2857011 RepID=UPI001E486BD1|nr:hypothetical protein [Actinoplanes sp. DH11]